MSSTTATHGDAVRVFSSVFAIAQSDTKNTEYLISWLQVTKNKSETVTFWVKYFFRAFSFLRIFTVWKELVCLFYKLLLPFSTLVNCKAPYQGLLHDLCLCFDIVFAQLVVIPRRRSKFIEIVAEVERYWVITRVKNKESKKQPLRRCLPATICFRWWKNKNKKVRNFFVPSLKFVSLGKMAEPFWKNRTFFMKISWIWTCS